MSSDEENLANENREMLESVASKKRLKQSEDMSEDGDDDARMDDERREDAVGNAGWADAMLRVLRLGVPSSADEIDCVKKRRVGGRKMSVILSRGKTDREVAVTREKKALIEEASSSAKKDDFEIERASGAYSEILPGSTMAEEPKSEKLMVTKSHTERLKESKERRLEKNIWENLAHVKPDVTNREKEKYLQRVATAGVVQLFNAVKQRQTTVETKLKKVGVSEIKREKVMKSMTKQDFLDVLKKAKSIRTPPTTKSSKVDDHLDGTTVNPTWEVLRDDYMMDAQMKDWDKALDTDDDGGGDDNLGSAPTNLLNETRTTCSDSDF